MTRTRTVLPTTQYAKHFLQNFFLSSLDNRTLFLSASRYA